MANPQVVVDFVANTAGLSRGFNQASSGAGGFGSKLKGLGRAAVVAGGAAGLAALTATLKLGVDEMSQAAKVSAQTQAVLKSTGGAAGVTAKQVSDLAGALMAKTGIDDEAIQSGENLLLTFTRVQNKAGKGNDIFNQATRIMTDMSVALGQDMKTSAIQLGKALNDPVKGITALQRVGVSFTQGQKDQIKALVASGRTMDAQKIILKELNKEFGGSAEAAGKTLPGQINILKESFSNLAGVLVSTLVPAFSAITKVLVKNPALFKALVIGALALAGAMVTLNAALAISAALSAGILGPLALIAAGLAAIVVVGVLVYKNWDKISGAMKKAMAVIKAAVSDVFNWIKRNWPLLVGILAGPIGVAVALVIRNWATIRNTTVSAWNAIKSTTTSIWNAIRGAVQAAVNAVRAAVQNAWNTIKNVTASVWGAVRNKIQDIVGAVKNALSGLAKWVSGWASGAWGAAVSRVASFAQRIAAGVHDAVNSAKNALNNLVSFVSGVAGRISGAAQRVANGIKAPINAVLRAWNGISLTIPRISIPSIKIGKHRIGGGSFGGQTIGFPDVPLLAKGAVIDVPTLAMVGEGQGREIVAPERLLRQIVAEGGGDVHVRVYIGDTELKGLVQTQISDSNTGIARALLAG